MGWAVLKGPWSEEDFPDDQIDWPDVDEPDDNEREDYPSDIDEDEDE